MAVTDFCEESEASCTLVPQIRAIINQDTVYGSGWVDVDTGEYTPVPGRVDQYGPIPSTKMDPPRLLLGGNADLGEFAGIVHLVLKVVEPNILFAHAWPKNIIDFQEEDVSPRSVRSRTTPVPVFQETITWSVFRREPGTLGGNKPFSGHRNIKPRIITRGGRDPNRPDDEYQLIDHYIQDFDNIVQFDIWTRSNKRAEELALRFETLMVAYAYHFNAGGINKCFFMRRYDDEILRGIGTGLQRRSLHYYVRTQSQYTLIRRRIKEIRAKILELVTTEAEATGYFTGDFQNAHCL